MNIVIVGLGLMGGAYAMKLSKASYDVYGVDINNQAIEFALKSKYIKAGSNNVLDFLDKADVLVLAIYPQAILDFLDKYHKHFTKNLIITDISGVKSSFIYEATAKALPAIYCSSHPMAGREKTGVEFSHLVSFDQANYLVVPTNNTTSYATKVIEKLGFDMSFARVCTVSPEEHDDMIGFTSQLCHAIAVSLVNSDHNQETKNFIGDSYRDLTRIAMINEALWSELFIENKEYLLKHINSFEAELDRLKNALNNSDAQELKEIFKSSTKIRREMEK